MFGVKLVLLIAILAAGAAGGAIPLLRKNAARNDRLLGWGNAFAAGVFLAAGIVHMLPDADRIWHGLGWDYPMAFALAGFAFIFMLLVEHVLLPEHAHEEVHAPSGERFARIAEHHQDALAAYAPSPATRGPAAAQGKVGEEQIEPNELAPLAMSIFKTTADPYVGKLTYFRVYGGIAESDSRIYNSRAEETERLGQLYVMRGKEQTPVPRLRTGDIGAVAKLTHTVTGDTLCDKGHPVTLAGPDFPAPLFAVADSPTSKADQAKLGPTLTRICEEDPTLHWRQELTTRQTILEGMGEAHLNIAVRRMENRFGVGVGTEIPRVPYRETITKEYGDRYRHKKQTGGAGQFAEVHMRLEPQPSDAGYEFEWKVFGGAISRSFESSIKKGIKQVMDQGVIAGYPVVDVKAIVYDGKEHPVDSKDIAFQVAGREVFKKVMMEAGPVLMEPIYDVTIIIPGEFTGDIMGDLNTKRAQVQGMDQKGDKSIITALVPLAEMQRYATDLRSLTQGRGLFSMELAHYANVPTHLMQQIIDAFQAEKEK